MYKYRLNEDEQVIPEGETRPRMRHGTGKYTHEFYSYDGEWEDDAMHGKGLYKYASGASYSGQFQKDKYHGQGKYAWPDGRVYDGAWEEGVMHGKGVFTDIEGRQWAGLFHNGTGPGLTELQP